MPIPLPLDALPLGCPAHVVAIHADIPLRRRLRSLGLIDGTPVAALFRNLSGDPTAYAIRGATIALRRADATKVLVQAESEVLP